jgi:hypothetical protein
MLFFGIPLILAFIFSLFCNSCLFLVNRFRLYLFYAGSQCNSATQTFDGVDLMGERLANEVYLFDLVNHRS